MKYTKKDLGSFGMHFINTDKFKTITVKVVFHTPIEKELITKRNVLTDILLQSSKKYETRRNLTIKAEDLYAADVSTNNQRLGNYILTSFILQVLNDKYTEENNFEKAIEFLSEIILNPDVDDKGFKEEKLGIVKNNTKIGIDSIKEDASNYFIYPSKKKVINLAYEIGLIPQVDIQADMNEYIRQNGDEKFLLFLTYVFLKEDKDYSNDVNYIKELNKIPKL